MLSPQGAVSVFRKPPFGYAQGRLSQKREVVHPAA